MRPKCISGGWVRVAGYGAGTEKPLDPCGSWGSYPRQKSLAAGDAGDLYFDRGGFEAGFGELSLDRVHDRIREDQLGDVSGGFLDQHLRPLAVAIGHSAGEVSVYDTNMVDQADLLKRGEDSVNADNVDLAARVDDLLVDGIRAESLRSVA